MNEKNPTGEYLFYSPKLNDSKEVKQTFMRRNSRPVSSGGRVLRIMVMIMANPGKALMTRLIRTACL